MNVNCRNGYIQFYPQEPEDLIRFQRILKVDLFRQDDFYTFEGLVGLPRHSLQGFPYAGLPASKTYEGRDPSEVFRENGLVYSLQFGAVVPIESITSAVKMSDALSYSLAQGPFIQPGARMSGTQDRLVSYSAWLSLDYQRLYVYNRETV